jgi:hypothetical protein
LDFGGITEQTGQPIGVPDIGANGDSDIEAGYIYYHWPSAGLEIPLLVKYTVIYQQALSINFVYFAGLQYSGRIVTFAPVAFSKTDYCGFVGAIGGELFDNQTIVL